MEGKAVVDEKKSPDPEKIGQKALLEMERGFRCLRGDHEFERFAAIENGAKICKYCRCYYTEEI